MHNLLGRCALLTVLVLAACETPTSSTDIPDRLVSCGAIGTRGLQLFEVCGLLRPEGGSKREITTSECGVVRLTRAEHAYLCQGAKALYGNMPALNRAERAVFPQPQEPIITYGDVPAERAEDDAR